MSIIKIPTTAVEVPGGAVFELFYNRAVLRTIVIKSEETIEDILHSVATGVIQLEIGDIDDILDAGGEVFQHLMAVRAPRALLNQEVPEGIPERLKWDGTVKTFNDLLEVGAEIWEKNDNSQNIWYTNPFAGNENVYLTGSEMKIINDIDPQVDILTVADADAETASGWTKL